MKINIKNNWVVEISDFDIRTATKEEALAIGKYILSNMVVF